MTELLGILCALLWLWFWALAKTAAKEPPTLSHREILDYENQQRWHQYPL